MTTPQNPNNPVTYKSDELLSALADANILIKNFDKVKARLIVREYFCQVHNEAVQSTVIATNKKNLVLPNFHDV